MIVISGSLPKSGSAYLYHLINDLISVSGAGHDMREIVRKYRLEKYIKGLNCDVGNLTEEKLKTLIDIQQIENTFAVKTHFYFEENTKHVREKAEIKSIYIYRDPRDVILSAIDHGIRLMERNRLDAYFTRYSDVDSSIHHIGKWLEIYLKWKQESNVLFVQYEDLISSPVSVLRKISTFINIEIDDVCLSDIILKGQIDGDNKDLHFNKGVIGRYKQVMSLKEIEMCNSQLGDYILDMGYEL